MDGMLLNSKVMHLHHQRFVYRYSFIHLSEERKCAVKFLAYGNNTTIQPRPRTIELCTQQLKIMRALFTIVPVNHLENVVII